MQGRRQQAEAAREQAAQADRRGTADLGLFSQQQAETFARLVHIAEFIIMITD
eukprot:COSAG01_NODE_2377_length_7801_cov_4.201117_11_plen_53_part_00